MTIHVQELRVFSLNAQLHRLEVEVRGTRPSLRSLTEILEGVIPDKFDWPEMQSLADLVERLWNVCSPTLEREGMVLERLRLYLTSDRERWAQINLADQVQVVPASPPRRRWLGEPPTESQTVDS